MCDRRSEAGFTLIELMIAVLLLGLIIVPLTGAMITGLISTGQATTRLSEARSPLFTSAFFADDVNSAERGLIAKGGAPSWQCGAGSNVLSLGWAETTNPKEPTSSPPPIRVSYVVGSKDGKPILRRNFCGPTSTSAATVAPVLTDDPPDVKCFDDANPPNETDCAAPNVRRVQLVAATPNAENYFTLVATRRAT